MINKGEAISQMNKLKGDAAVIEAMLIADQITPEKALVEMRLLSYLAAHKAEDRLNAEPGNPSNDLPKPSPPPGV